MTHERMYLTGPNGFALPRTVYVGEREVGTVSPSQYSSDHVPLWKAYDKDGRLHGDTYTSDWNAAKQMALALGISV